VCVAVWCILFNCVALFSGVLQFHFFCSLLPSVVVCCSLLQSVAVNYMSGVHMVRVLVLMRYVCVL